MSDGSKWWWMVGLVVLGMIGFGCGDGCRNVPPPTGVQGAHALADAIPGEASVVIFAEELGELLGEWSAVESLGFVEVGSLPKESAWRAAGVWVEGPTAAFWHDGQWVVLGWLDQEVEGSLQALSVSGDPREVEGLRRREQGWREAVDGGGYRWARADQRRVALGWSGDEASEPLDERIWELDEGRYRVDRQQWGWFLSDYPDESSGPVGVHGGVDLSLVGDGLDLEGPGAHLAAQIVARLGWWFWRVVPPEASDRERWNLEIRTSDEGQARDLISDLGEGAGELPPMGGLARPGVPAVIRLSADPARLWGFVRAVLSPQEQDQLEQMVTTLRDELQIDLEADVIANIEGQVAVVVFGMEDDFFEATGMEFWSSLVRLENTREALVIPIEDRARIERVLDAMTQLARGSLIRQTMEKTNQYAWFDDGQPSWAIISGDDYLVVVDSLMAFDHVASWKRSARRLDETMAHRGVGAMMTGNRGLAAYVDADILRGIFREEGAQELVRWFANVEAIRFETDVEGQPERTDLVLWLTEEAAQHRGGAR